MIFFAVVLAGSALLVSQMLRSGRPIQELPLYVVLLMWLPAAASVVARSANGEGFADLSFRLRDRRVLGLVGLAVLFPVAVGALAYGTAWGLGLVSFAPPAGTGNPLPEFAGRLLVAVSVGAGAGVVTAAGEEIGWRGYMVPRLVEARFPAPVVAGGVVWGCWHLPLILSGQYAAGPHRLLSAALFVLLAVALTVLWSTWTFVSGSIWPAILGHAAWNAVIQGPFDAFSHGPLASALVGESGVLVVAAAVLVVAVLCSGRIARRVGARRDVAH